MLVLHMHVTIAIAWKILQDATELPRSFTLLQLIFSVLFIVVYVIFKQYVLRKGYKSVYAELSQTVRAKLCPHFSQTASFIDH